LIQHAREDKLSAVFARERRSSERSSGAGWGRAADLSHEHLADYPDDDVVVRAAIVTALGSSTDERLRRRAREFTG
jgi:hypothetical protein